MAPRILAASLLALAFAEAVAQSSALRVGPQDRRCDGAWALGPSECAQRDERAVSKESPEGRRAPPAQADRPPPPSPAVAATAPQPAPAPASPLQRQRVSEAEVDAYLAAHGKPPREAVRAILDPTDGNILAYQRRVQRDQAVALFIAQRLDELRRADAPDASIATDLAALAALRVRLHVVAQCEACDRSQRALQQLALAYPLMDVEVVYHGADSQLLWLEQARLGSTLPTRAAEAPERAQLAGHTVPLLGLHDLRTERKTQVAAPTEYEPLRTVLLAQRETRP